MQPRYSVLDSQSTGNPTAGNLASGNLATDNPGNLTGGLRRNQMQQQPNAAQQQSLQDQIAKIFNTALVATQAETKRDFSGELCQLTQSAPFKAILSAVRHLSRVQGIPEKQAAEMVIQTFRKMDEIWKQYLHREGLERLRNQR